MDPMAQRILVQTHIAALEADAASMRLARTARAAAPKASIRAALGRALIAVGTALAAAPIEEPRRDAARGA
jgi:hypothetical protein